MPIPKKITQRGRDDEAGDPGIVVGGTLTRISKDTGIPISIGGALHAADVVKREDKWDGPLPPHWSDKSRSKFYKSMSQKEGPTTNCIKKIGNHVDDPGAFCASLRDRVTGTTKWRSGAKKK